jgi:tRNA 5-methylaminomethyl-2-thiouridine biosynthesis bifunctional protein
MSRRAIVIGAGLAGSSAAERLAARGWTIELIERADAPGQGASGNLAGVLRPAALGRRQPPGATDACRLRRRLRIFASLTAAGLPLRWGQTGVLHLARDDTHAATQQRVVEIQQPAADYLRFVDRDEASQLAGWPVARAAGGSPAAAGSIPRRFAGPTWLATRRRSGRTTAAGSQKIERRRISGEPATPLAPHCRSAGADSRQRQRRPMLCRGRASAAARCARAGLASARRAVRRPAIVVCRLGYVTPAIDGLRCAGATFSSMTGKPRCVPPTMPKTWPNSISSCRATARASTRPNSAAASASARCRRIVCR